MSRIDPSNEPARKPPYQRLYGHIRRQNVRIAVQDDCITWLLNEIRALQKRVAQLEKRNEGFLTHAALRKLAHDNVERVRELEQRGDLPSQEDGDKTLGCAPATTGL